MTTGPGSWSAWVSDYQLVVFDWDGTLCDSIGRIVASVRAGTEWMGLPQRSDEAIKGIIGLGLAEAIRSLFPELEDEADVERFRLAYSEHYVEQDQSPPHLFPGVIEVLEGLRDAGYHLAVATGKSRRGLDRVLRGLGWLDYFDATRCADETASKPDPRMLQELMQQLQVPAARTLMVGDASFDLLMARHAGVDSVAVAYGAQPLVNLRDYQPRFEIEHFAQLPGCLAAPRRT